MSTWFQPVPVFLTETKENVRLCSAKDEKNVSSFSAKVSADIVLEKVPFRRQEVGTGCSVKSPCCVQKKTSKEYFREFLRYVCVLCDICDDVNVQRVIKLNCKERTIAEVLLKKADILGLKRRKAIVINTVPRQSCGDCFTKIQRFRSYLRKNARKKVEEALPDMDQPNHGHHCQCLACQNRYGSLPLLLKVIEERSKLESHYQMGAPEGNVASQSCFRSSSQHGISSQRSDESEAVSGPHAKTEGDSEPVGIGLGAAGVQAIKENPIFRRVSPRDDGENLLPVSLKELETGAGRSGSPPSGPRPSTSRCREERQRTKKVLACAHCDKKFTHRGDFNKHLRKHTKERPFGCNFCGKNFAHTSNLHRHRKIHSGDRPFRCHYCDKSFNRKDKLASHKNSKFCKIRRS